MPPRRSRSFLPPLAASAEFPPGPQAGRVWPDATVATRDAVTGCSLMQLTDYRGHSHHACGPAPCWLRGGDALVLRSDRDGCSNLFEFDFAAGRLVQLTDLRGNHPPQDVRADTGPYVSFRYGPDLFELDRATLRLRIVEGPGRAGRTIASAAAPARFARAGSDASIRQRCLAERIWPAVVVVEAFARNANRRRPRRSSRGRFAYRATPCRASAAS